MVEEPKVVFSNDLVDGVDQHGAKENIYKITKSIAGEEPAQKALETIVLPGLVLFLPPGWIVGVSKIGILFMGTDDAVGNTAQHRWLCLPGIGRRNSRICRIGRSSGGIDG